MFKKSEKRYLTIGIISTLLSWLFGFLPMCWYLWQFVSVFYTGEINHSNTEKLQAAWMGMLVCFGLTVAIYAVGHIIALVVGLTTALREETSPH